MTKKLSFKKSGDREIAKQTGIVGSGSDIVLFRTIETKTNPSDLAMVIRKTKTLQGEEYIRIPLVDFKTSCQYIKDRFVLDLRNLERFQDSDKYHFVIVSFEAIDNAEPIDVELFYTLEDHEEYTWHVNQLRMEALQKSGVL